MPAARLQAAILRVSRVSVPVDTDVHRCATMADCQDKDFLVRSPNYEKAVAAAITTAAAANLYLSRAAEQMEEAGMDEEVAASILDTVTGFLDAIFPFL